MAALGEASASNVAAGSWPPAPPLWRPKFWAPMLQVPRSSIKIVGSCTRGAGAGSGAGVGRFGPGDAALAAPDASRTSELGPPVQGTSHVHWAFPSAFTDPCTTRQPRHAQCPP